MTPRRCLGCSRRIPSGSRCASCNRAREREKSARRGTPAHYAGDWRAVSLATRKAHVERYGLRCPGYRVRPHAVAAFRDLTVDHVQAGSRDAGLVVLCRSCNARKGTR